MRALLLLAVLVGPAEAHPGADAHLHATEADACAPDTRARRLAALIDENRLTEAREELEARRGCPGEEPALVVAEAELLWLEGHPDLASPLLDTLLREEPTHAGAREVRARVHEALGRPEHAAADWLAMARHHEKALDPWLQAAALSPENAADWLDEALERQGPVPVLVQAAARAHLAGDPARALALLADQPDTVDTWLLRAEAHQRAGDPAAAAHARDAALSAVQAMRPSPKRTELLARLEEAP